ncbi:MAG: hypothetical protein AAGD05_14910, partial [Bacteroidota bacterium]
MKPKIGIMELMTHHEVLRAYLLGFLANDLECYCFTTAFNQELNPDLIDHPQIHWHLPSHTQTRLAYLTAQSAVLSQLDVLIITTPFSFDQWPSSLLCKKMVLLIHGLHFWFHPWFAFSRLKAFPSVRPNVLRFLKIPSTLQRRRNLRRWLPQVDCLLVGQRQLQEYAKQSKWSIAPQLKVLEFYVAEKKAPIYAERSAIHIGVPGNIHPNSRDYTLLLRVFRQLAQANLPPIQLFFPSRAQTGFAQKLQQELGQLAPQITCHFYEHYLGQATYDQILLAADFLFCPIQQFSYNGCIGEQNGQSHLSA